MTDALFVLFAVLALVTGARVFLTQSMVRASFFLLASFLAVAGVLLLLGSDFLGGITVLMMTGEMVIMAVFMVMFMMSPGGLMPMTMVHAERGAAGAAVATFLALTAVAVTTPWPVRSQQIPADDAYLIGMGMMGPKMLVFLVAGVALLAAMIAALALALHRGRYDRYGDRLDRPRPADPVPGMGGPKARGGRVQLGMGGPKARGGRALSRGVGR